MIRDARYCIFSVEKQESWRIFLVSSSILLLKLLAFSVFLFVFNWQKARSQIHSSAIMLVNE